MIEAYCGTNGAGKTLLAVTQMLEKYRRLRHPRPILSTVELRESPDGEVISEPIESWEHLIRESHNRLILLDEVSTLAAGRETTALPSHAIAWMESMRHTNSALLWTSPVWMDCDIKLRGVTQLMTQVSPMLRGFAGTRRELVLADGSVVDDLWRPTYWLSARRYKVMRSAGAEPGIDQRQGWPSVHRLRGLAGFGCYDTRAEVLPLSEHAVNCNVCGKRKRTEYCSGHQHEATVSARETPKGRA